MYGMLLKATLWKKYSLDYERYIECAELWSAVHRTPQEKQKWLKDREVSIVILAIYKDGYTWAHDERHCVSSESAVRDLMKENMQLWQRIAVVAIPKKLHIWEPLCCLSSKSWSYQTADSALCFVVLFCILSYLFVAQYKCLWIEPHWSAVPSPTCMCFPTEEVGGHTAESRLWMAATIDNLGI